jgi:hypothetical protein
MNMAANRRHPGSPLVDFDHVIVSLLDSGLSIFHHSYTDKEIDPDLFSALVTATSLTDKVRRGSQAQDMHEVFEVEEYTAHLCHGEYLAGIIVSARPVQDTTIRRFVRFLASFEEEYAFIIKNWHGDRTFFDQGWALNQLEASLNGMEENYRLSEDAMDLTRNARQIRLVLLVQRHGNMGEFNMSTIQGAIESTLQVPSSVAKEYLSELEAAGIVTPI